MKVHVNFRDSRGIKYNFIKFNVSSARIIYVGDKIMNVRDKKAL